MHGRDPDGCACPDAGLVDDRAVAEILEEVLEAPDEALSIRSCSPSGQRIIGSVTNARPKSEASTAHRSGPTRLISAST